MDELVAKRHELQLLLLREGYTQDEARKMAAEVYTEKLDECLERIREDAMRFPERAIVPPGTVDLADLKSQREEAKQDAEEAEYFANRNELAVMMAKSFSLDEMPLAVLRGGLNRSTQHFILGGKDGVWDGTEIS